MAQFTKCYPDKYWGFFLSVFSVMLDVGFVNLVSIISQNPKVTAINSCIEVDLTGQVVSDSIGSRIYSGNEQLFYKQINK